MLDKKMKEALDLVGGRAVFKDADQYYVLLTLKEFKKMKQEGLGSLTKQELIDKINNDIASWRYAQEEKEIENLDLEELGSAKEEEVRYEKT